MALSIRASVFRSTIVLICGSIYDMTPFTTWQISLIFSGVKLKNIVIYDYGYFNVYTFRKVLSLIYLLKLKKLW